eukprot:CAMPEP_0177732974 /NCGR_PEP_ID=MMETSP0484_2-20121128/23420_1 /TAXON_ID=354590 /ORGANISM="Rhodomonas lens, Strain RHODO" /LENGTH=34 /DNA_ID= /DNA_START= /DNA_END= /DNA_ORIENTATION=
MSMEAAEQAILDAICAGADCSMRGGSAGATAAQR